MVSKASDDLPEPDRPVKTTSLSRGISTSMFFRLCSRAPRMVIARVAEPACWRFALITSSISAFPGALMRLRSRRASSGKTGIGRQWVRSEHRKNGSRFPVSRANHQRFVGSRRVFSRKPWRDGGSRQQYQWNQNKKTGARPAFCSFNRVARRLKSVLRDHRATPAVVDADSHEIDVLADAVGAEGGTSGEGAKKT